MRDLPIFTFVNKMDRPALEGLELLDQIEKEFDLPTFAVNWPIGSGDRFVGVLDRISKDVHIYTKSGAEGRAKGALKSIYKWDDPIIETLVDEDLLAAVREEVEMLDELVGKDLDVEAVLDGRLTPVFFGSAMNNFGVELFLKSFMQVSEAPQGHEAVGGEEIGPADTRFTGLVFKLQANMDPKHRDKVAFVRVRSGHFTRGMKVQVARTGKTVTLSRPQKMFAQDRETIEEGYAGDIIGLNNPDAFAIGDTIYSNGSKVEYPGIPMFSPELFAVLRLNDPSKRKQFQKGLASLLGEGAVQVLYSRDDFKQDPIMAAVGQLQLEVVQSRMMSEYGCDVSMEPLPFAVARWVEGGWDALEAAGDIYNATAVKDQWGRPVLLFRNEWSVASTQGDKPELGELLPYSMPPSTA